MVQLHAMDALHQYDYNVVDAIKNLVSGGGPVLCRDEMEEWSASEANLFEEALDKYGKSFREIGLDFVRIVKQCHCFVAVASWEVFVTKCKIVTYTSHKLTFLLYTKSGREMPEVRVTAGHWRGKTQNVSTKCQE